MAEPFRPRPAQEHILSYTGGYMGVSAVPGSGKTFTLSLLAAKLVQQLARTAAFDDREVLIVAALAGASELLCIAACWPKKAACCPAWASLAYAPC